MVVVIVPERLIKNAAVLFISIGEEPIQIRDLIHFGVNFLWQIVVTFQAVNLNGLYDDIKHTHGSLGVVLRRDNPFCKTIVLKWESKIKNEEPGRVGQRKLKERDRKR